MTRPGTDTPQWVMADEGWGRKAVDFATLSEPGNCREYVAVHHRLGVDAGDRLLDVACGSGLAIELARVRGALCSGVDASARLVAVARDRNPGDWLPVPEPLATLIIKHAADRANTSTAANAASSWLFPGGMPGDHLDRNYLLTVLRNAGIPVLAARNATWQHLVRAAPPQVLAGSLGISPRHRHAPCRPGRFRLGPLRSHQLPGTPPETHRPGQRTRYPADGRGSA